MRIYSSQPLIRLLLFIILHIYGVNGSNFLLLSSINLQDQVFHKLPGSIQPCAKIVELCLLLLRLFISFLNQIIRFIFFIFKDFALLLLFSEGICDSCFFSIFCS